MHPEQTIPQRQYDALSVHMPIGLNGTNELPRIRYGGPPSLTHSPIFQSVILLRRLPIYHDETTFGIA
jgi:hypothetical protein